MSANLFMAAVILETKKHEIEDEERREEEAKKKDADFKKWGNAMHRLEDL